MDESKKSDSSPKPEIPTLISGRQKRSNAGSKMARLLNQEEEDTEADAIYSSLYGGFAEEENDDDYQSSSAAGDDEEDDDDESSTDSSDSDADVEEYENKDENSEKPIKDDSEAENSVAIESKVTEKTKQKKKTKQHEKEESENEKDEEDEEDEEAELAKKRQKRKRRVITKAYKEPIKSESNSANINNSSAQNAFSVSQSKSRRPTLKRDGEEATPSSQIANHKTLRSSTHAVTQSSNANSAVKQTAAVKDVAQRKGSAPAVRRITQEELLEEARITEQINLRSLANYERLETEKKKLLRMQKHAAQKVPIIRFHSVTVCVDDVTPARRKASVGVDVGNGDNETGCGDADDAITPAGEAALKCSRNFVSFSEEAAFRAAFPTLSQTAANQTARMRARPHPVLCPITARPARYLDPLTRTYYANVYAFRVIRQLYQRHLDTGERPVDLLRRFRRGELQVDVSSCAAST